MSSHPQVSVIMPAYNAAKTIVASIESVLGQTYQHWELLVINDGSTDHTLDVLAQLDDQRIRIVTQVNQGVAAARNTGLKQARGEYIAFLDSDDLWLPKKLEKQIALFAGSSSLVGLVYTKHRGFTLDPAHSFSMDVDFSIGYQNPYHRLLIMDYVPTLTVMIRSSIVTDIGYFSEDLRGTEDWDYWIRIAKIYSLERLNEELALYRFSPNSLSRNKDRHAIEELKVLNRHLSPDSNIPPAVCHMARGFWYLKRTRYQLEFRRLKDATISLLAFIRIRPAYCKNYFFLIVWAISFIYRRIIVDFIRNIVRR